jgi:Trypsin-like peptidase domain
MGSVVSPSLRCAAASLCVLLAAAPAFAQDSGAAPSYPQEQAQPRVKATHPRRPAPVVRKSVQMPLPPRRPVQSEPKREASAASASPPLPPVKPAETPAQPKFEAAATPVPLPPATAKVAAVPKQEPPKETAPAPPPINEGGTNDWRVLTDPATGIVIGIPRRLLSEMHNAPHGTRWSAPHGEIQLETFRLSETSLTLAAFFEKMKREPANRKIEFDTLKDDSFVLGGTQGLRDFYIRASVKSGEIRGFTLIYDVAMETIMEPLRVIISNAFTPFPDKPAGFALPEKTIEYGSGVIVSRDGHIVTSARLAESCSVLRVPGLGPAERVAMSDGMTLLRVYGMRKLTPVPLSNSAPTGPLTLVGVPDPHEQSGASGTRELAAKLAGEAIELVKTGPVAGFSGAAALDREGRLAGLVDLSSAAVASTGAPPLRIVNAAAIRAFLSREGVQPEEANSGNAKAAIVRVTCVRK